MPLRAKSGASSFSTNITTAARQGQAAIRSSLKSLSPASRGRVKSAGLTSSRIIPKTNTDVLARATSPSITFAVEKTGKLATTKVLGTARHEVAHFSLPVRNPSVPFSGQHFTLRAAGARGQNLSVPNAGVLRRAEGVARQPSTTRVATSLKFLGAQLRKRKTSQVK